MAADFTHVLDLCQNGADIFDDSRKLRQGGVFVAIPGAAGNGEEYIKDALAAGAGHIVCRKEALDSIPESQRDRVVTHEDPRAALWQLAVARWRVNESGMRIIGITGTNGKTTTAFLLEHLFMTAGVTTGVLGTITYHWPGHSIPAPLTTPGPLQLHSILAEMAQTGVKVVIMEVSSHALAQQRTGGLPFAGAVFSNLTQDHLDFHGNMENYFRAKATLFTRLPRQDKAMAINGDDSYGRRLLELLPGAVSYGLHAPIPGQKHLRGRILGATTAGMTLGMDMDGVGWELRTPLVGAFNAMNLLGAQAIALQMGIEHGAFACFEKFNGVPGRLERIDNDRNLHIFVDYAHTPDALVNALKALRGAGFKRIVTVFGCGGNRDRSKRPLMGKAVAQYSDVAILTSDNPRHESPEQIMRDVRPGLSKAASLHMEVDRKKATAMGIEMLGRDDALLIAGKGHEDYQIIGDTKIHYSDQEIVRELLSCA